VVAGDAGVGSGDRSGCWGGGQVVWGWGGQVVNDWRWWGGEFGVLDGDDVSGGCGVTGDQCRVKSSATLLTGGEEDGVLWVVDVGSAGGCQRLGELDQWVSGGHVVRRALDNDRRGSFVVVDDAGVGRGDWKCRCCGGGHVVWGWNFGVVDDGQGGVVGGVRVCGQIGAAHAETVDRVGHVSQGLDDAVGVHVRVTTTGHAVRSALFVLGRRTTGVTVRVLAQFILGVVLGGSRSVVHWKWVHCASAGYCYDRCCEKLQK